MTRSTAFAIVFVVLLTVSASSVSTAGADEAPRYLGKSAGAAAQGDQAADTRSRDLPESGLPHAHGRDPAR